MPLLVMYGDTPAILSEAKEHLVASCDFNAYIAIIESLGDTLMATITIRNLDSQLKTKLRIRAAQHDRSMEEEVRIILKTVLATESLSETKLAASIHNRFRVLGGVDLVNVVREPIRDPEVFSE